MDNLIGKTYNKLTIIKILGRDKHGEKMCLTTCDCGGKKEARIRHVISGDTKSCGCLYGKHTFKHGLADSKLAKVLKAMKYRCYNEKTRSYKDYGGRGIKVCDEWIKDRQAFYTWALSNGYREDLQIDRIDNDGNYEPSNCRWVTAEVNVNNRRNSKYVTYKGVTKTASQWAHEYKQDPRHVIDRLRKGWNIERALCEPVIRKSKIK